MADRRSFLPSGRFDIWDIASAEESPAPRSPSVYGDENVDPNAEVIPRVDQDNGGIPDLESDGEWDDESDFEDSEEEDGGDAEQEIEETEEEEEYGGNGDDLFNALVNDVNFGFMIPDRITVERLGNLSPQLPEWRRQQALAYPTEESREQNRPAPIAQPTRQGATRRVVTDIDPNPDFHVHEDEQENRPAPNAAPTMQDARALRDITGGAPTITYQAAGPRRLRPRVFQYSLNVGKWLPR